MDFIRTKVTQNNKETVEIKAEVIKWKTFPLYWKVFKEHNKGKSLKFKIFNFYMCMKAYGSLLFNKNK